MTRYQIGDKVWYYPCGRTQRGQRDQWFERRRRLAVVVDIEITIHRISYHVAIPNTRLASDPRYPGQAIAIVDECLLYDYSEDEPQSFARGTDTTISPIK